ncbi:hypothetical protein [Streptomyces sp. HNM1019]|uniref:hypothetical protein n=1 Tax=Streptomyces sp. HNM1019 TaxID=3424717 RepID=UPI003D781605
MSTILRSTIGAALAAAAAAAVCGTGCDTDSGNFSEYAGPVILAELDGVVRWGGDDRKPDESLSYLVVRPGDRRLTEVVARLDRWRETPGSGAGAPVDVLASKRRTAATSLAGRQGATS